MAKMTLSKSQLVTVYWILFAEEDLYNLWREVCNKWLVGTIKDSHGKLGVVKDAKSINAAMFRCFESDLMEFEIKMVLERVNKGKALLKKDSSFMQKIDTMEDLALTTKLFKRLQGLIIDFYRRFFPTQFSNNCTWANIIEVIPDLKTSKEIRRCRLGATDKYLKSLSKRTLPREKNVFPQGLVFRLEHLYYMKFGGSKHQRIQPYVFFLQTT